MIFNNTCRRNRSGIGVYSNAVGPVANNYFIGNTVSENYGSGITAGGFGHIPTKTSEGNVFIGTRGFDNAGHNGGQLNPHHGATAGDFWTGNDVTGDAPMWAPFPDDNASAFTIFEP